MEGELYVSTHGGVDVKMCRVICHLISGSILNSDSAQVCIF